MAATVPAPRISAVIPAYNEQGRVGATAAAARAIPGVVEVIVVDDGSRDSTADEATGAGARVISAPHRGKGAALRRGAAAAAGELALLLDADIGDSAANAAALIEPVAADRADMTIAVLPPPGKRPGFGLALGAARIGLWLLTGRVFAAPLSGQRCVAAKLARNLLWARGFGAEVAATADAAALGARITEVPADIAHAPTERTLAGFLHRGRQFAAAIAVCLARALYPIGPTARPAPARRFVLAACSWGALTVIGSLVHLWAAAVAAAVAFGIVVVALSLAVNHSAGMFRPNYRGRPIPTAGGLAFAVGPLAAWDIAAAHGHQAAAILVLCAAGAAVMGAAGLADDLHGSRNVSGLAGHLGRLARGKVTTGAVKAVVGVAVGLVVGWLLADGSIAVALVNAGVIALSANFVNLLDVRPGRALKGFALLAAIVVASELRAVYAIAPMAVIALAFAPVDLSGRAMMGDAGANALGVVAGIALAASLPLWAKVVLATALVGIHAYSERRSISDLVERSRALRWLDQLGRVEEDVA